MATFIRPAWQKHLAYQRRHRAWMADPKGHHPLPRIVMADRPRPWDQLRGCKGGLIRIRINTSVRYRRGF